MSNMVSASTFFQEQTEICQELFAFNLGTLFDIQRRPLSKNWDQFERSMSAISNHPELADVYRNVIENFSEDNKKIYNLSTKSQGMACIHEAPHGSPEYVRVFNIIRPFAYNTLGYTPTAAVEYTQRWIVEYPCDMANKFVNEVSALIDSGLGYILPTARQWALQNADKYCGGDYRSEYQRLYQFAYSSNGLNYIPSRALAYALPQITKEFFSCNQRFGI